MAVDKLVDSGQLDGYFYDIADAIRNKYDETGDPDAWDYTYTPTEMPQAILDIPTGGGGEEVEKKDVNFYDYDGTLLYSYEATEFLYLEEMPENPLHDGLTAQGWNWEIPLARSYVTDHGKLNIGQMYVTNDGKTRIYFNPTKSTLSPYLHYTLNGTMIIDWGDGSSDTVTDTSMRSNKSTLHTYAAAGSYVITCTVTGQACLGVYYNSNNTPCITDRGASGIYSGAPPYMSRVEKIELGENMIIGHTACYGAENLLYITIPEGGMTTVGGDTFNDCNSLKSITIPTGVSGILNRAFANCYALTSICIPESIRNVKSQAFQSCFNLREVYLPDALTALESQAFQSCYVVENIILGLSTSVSNLSYLFTSCKNLTSFDIPDHITNIGMNTFSNCVALTEITIPSSVATIDAGAFNACYSLKEIHLNPTTPPTLLSTSVFSGLPADYIMYVPAGSLSTYQSATNWSTYASHMQEE